MPLMDDIRRKAKRYNKHILLPEGLDERSQRAAAEAVCEGIARVTLLGGRDEIYEAAKEREINLTGVSVVEPGREDRFRAYVEEYCSLREKKGMTMDEAAETMRNPMFYAAMMIKEGEADGLIAGANTATADVLRPGLQIVKTLPGVSTVSACYIMSLKKKDMGADGLMLFADCSVTPEPTAEQLADIAVSTALTARKLCGIEPNVAMLSFSTKGSASHGMVDKMAKATALAQKMAPDVNIDGELQADAAIVEKVGKLKCPGSTVAGKANVLIFPDLAAANIAYKLVQRITDAEALGPISQGFRKPFNDLSRGCSAEDVLNLIAITAVQAGEGC